MEWFDRLVDEARQRARARVAEARAKHPEDDQTALARRLVRAAALRAGLAGAATGTLALITLPIGLPAGVAATLFFESELIFELLELYGFDSAGDAGRLKLYSLWAGAGFADAAKSVGLRTGASALGRVLLESLPAQLIRRLNPALVKLILRRLGLGWLPKAMKLWPLIGAPISFVIDRGALRTLGEATLATLDDTARERRRQSRTGRRRSIKLAPA